METTAKGHIERLPSGAYRVKVYAGTDPVTGKERRLRERCPDETSAAIMLGRLVREAEGHQVPERDALFGRSSASKWRAVRVCVVARLAANRDVALFAKSIRAG